MSDANGPGPPIQIERIETEHLEGDTLVVRLSGRWRGHERAYEGQELLVVELADGRRRFPAIPEQRRAAIARPGAWSAKFVLPEWSRPGPGWEASLLIGDAVIPVPGSNDAIVANVAERMDGDRQVPAASLDGAARLDAPAAAGPLPYGGVDLAEDPRSGPLSKLLLRDTVAALHAELEQRAAGTAQLRGRLADANAELEARVSTHADLETTHGELRRELDALGELVRQDGAGRMELEASAEALSERAAGFEMQLDEAHRRREELEGELTDARRRIGDLERDLGEATAAREQRAGESERLRAQLSESTAAHDRLAAEAASLRDELATVRATAEREIAAATRAQAREHALNAEIARLHAELAGANVARDSARSETTGLRTELDRLGTELAALREQAGKQGELGEAKALLSDAKALSALLRERQEAKRAETA
jgi:predicted  nucleic acid-binding Zn-ribbon protein